MSVIGVEEGIVHGTLKGYKQHRYRKVESCEACLQAVREDNASRAAKRTTPRTRKPKPAEARQQAVTRPTSTDHEPSPFGVIHGDTAREPALTYIPYVDERGRAAERRERVKAALTCFLLDAGDLLDALGIPAEEAGLARGVAARITGGR